LLRLRNQPEAHQDKHECEDTNGNGESETEFAIRFHVSKTSILDS
jgi:hypothetical protein